MDDKNIYHRYNILVKKLEELSGYDIDNTLDSRLDPLPILRDMLCVQLKKEGYTLKEIADVLHKDHSTVVTGINTFKNILDYPGVKYSQMVSIYNKFIDNVNDSITIKLYPSQWEALQKLAKILCGKGIQ